MITPHRKLKKRIEQCLRLQIVGRQLSRDDADFMEMIGSMYKEWIYYTKQEMEEEYRRNCPTEKSDPVPQE